MQKDARTRGLALAVLTAVAVGATFIAFGLRPDGIANHYHAALTLAGFAVWLTGWIVATFSPPILAIACWFGAKKLRHGWVLHFLLPPMTYATMRGAVATMLAVANEPDDDGLTGWATDPAAMLALLCPLAYFAALGFTNLRRRSVRADDR